MGGAARNQLVNDSLQSIHHHQHHRGSYRHTVNAHTLQQAYGTSTINGPAGEQYNKAAERQGSTMTR